MRRNERHAYPQDSGDQPATARQNKSGLAVIAFAGRRLFGELQQRPMHVEKWHKLQNDGQIQHGNEGFLHSRADKTHAQENRGEARMHDQRDIRGRVFLVKLAQTLRQVEIEACNERNPRRAGKPSRGDAGNGNAQHESEGGNDPGHMNLLGHVTDRLNDALQDADILLAHGHEQRQSCADIQNTGEKSSPANGAGKRSPGILNLVTHDGGQFKADQAKADDSKRTDQANVTSKTKIGCRHGSAKTKEHDESEADERNRGDRSTDPAQIIDPLTDAQTAHIQGNQKNEKHDRCAECEPMIVGKHAGARTRDVNGDADEIEKNRRHVENVVGPVAPTREEAVEVAEYPFRPKIYATLTRIAVRQLDDRDALRPEKKQQSQGPKPDGYATIGRDGRNHVEVDDGDDK